ncbi:MAG: 30S ribosomal protein S12 methylthiotransferase RimO [Bacteroidia bacterium]|jgi:ribosomal protein S12 methylthiotransferase|nr:30S ribosomal protein S12 methylthiotransferase RimO [Bacteroidia bacterium]
MTKKKIDIVTLGCSKNTVDSEHLAGLINPEQYQVNFDSGKPADVVIINTCGFIGDAKEQSVDTILQYADMRKRKKIERLIVIGCLSERYGADLKREIHEVDAFFGANDMQSVALHLGSDPSLVNTIYQYKRNLSTPKHYAYLKISEGCDRTCSFCAIPLMRGKHVSVPIEQLVAEAKNLAQNGVKELVLIAQDLTYYGIDRNGKRQIVQLIDKLGEIDGVEWIRLQYAYPYQFPIELLNLIDQHPKLCRYLDMPLQHISDRVLRSMRRFVTRAQTLRLIENIREKVPGLAFRTTLIAGYPGETEEEFEELCQFVETQRFERLGIFAYSHEEGTRAHLLEDNVPDELKQQRVNRIMEIQQEISLEHNTRLIGKTMKVLIDRIEAGHYVGRTEFDSPEVDNEVLIPEQSGLLLPGKFYNIKIDKADYFDLYGSLVP